MKKLIAVFILSILSPVIIMAQGNNEPVFVPGMFAIKISPNGKWVGSQAGYAAIYNTETNEMISYSGGYLGNGNTIADNGMAVGDGENGGCIMWDGEIIYPETFSDGYYSPNAITRDATRIAGFMNNPEKNEVAYVPFVVDMSSTGEVPEPIALPYPKLDLFKAPPYMVSAQCISDDGKVIIGQVQDWRGMYTYPILYVENEAGEWSYILPSEQLFNPTHIELPQNPWLYKPEYPYPEDFMTGTKRDAYLEAYKAWSTGMGSEPMVDEYMSEEQFQEYKEAVDEYNEWYYGEADKISEYVKIYDQVLATTPDFSLSETCIHPSGDYFMAHGGVIDEENKMLGKIFVFSKDGEILKEIQPENADLYPSQILSDGTLVATLPVAIGIPTTYLMLPEEEEFISIQDFLRPENSSFANWIDETIPYGTGHLVSSDNLSVMAGGLLPDNLASYTAGDNFRFSSYIMTNINTAAVETIDVSPTEGVYRVYNLQGLKLMETKNQEDIRSLEKGIYIINGKKVVL